MIYAGGFRTENSEIRLESVASLLNSITGFRPFSLSKDNFFICLNHSYQNSNLNKVLENDLSVLIGRIFEKQSNEPLKKSKFNSLVNLNKEEIYNNYWGKFVLFKKQNEGKKLEIFIDPTGQLPLFYSTINQGIIFSSHIEILLKILSIRPNYNWQYFKNYLIFGNRSSIQTPFKGIYELPPGCQLILSEEVKISNAWDPTSIFLEEKVEDHNDIVNTLTGCMQAWTKPYENILISLSGGLDSSSLTYCLKQVVKNDQNLQAINYFHPTINTSNELVYARRVCKETQIGLIEADISDALPFDVYEDKNNLLPNKPSSDLLTLKCAKKVYDYFDKDTKFCFITGHGSDHIFMCPPSKNSILDCLFNLEINKIPSKLEEIAKYYRCSYFSILQENIKSVYAYLVGKQKNTVLMEHLKNIPLWMRKHAETDLFEYFHPIYKEIHKRMVPGKFEQIDNIYNAVASIHTEVVNPEDPTFYPFLYHPMIETALSYPSHELYSRGFDRFPLRKAIGNHFHTDVVYRRDKGQTGGLFQMGVRNNLGRILEFCLEGYFSRQNFIQKDDFHKTIKLISSGDMNHLWPFIHVTSSEMFLNSWDKKFGFL